MPGAGELRDRYAFQRLAAPSGDADQGAWETVLTCAAKTTYLRGGEGVQQARLAGSQPVVLTIRVSIAARQISNAWRAVDTRDPTRIFNITGVELTADRAFLDVLAVRSLGKPNG